MAERGSSETGYRAIARRIEGEVGVGPSDTKLASERSLAERFACQRGTVRRALTLLESRGVIYRRARSGWYSTPASLDYVLTGSTPLAELTAQMGRDLQTELLATTQPKNHHSPDSMVFVARRRRRLDGWPIVVEDLHLRPELSDRIKHCDLQLSTKTILASVGIDVSFEQAILDVVAAPSWVRDALGLRVGGSVLRIARQRFTGDQLIQSDTEWWRSKAVRLHVAIGGNDVRPTA